MLDCPMRTRIDCLNSILIDAVVMNYRSRGIQSAARALAKNHVSLEVALRVLTQPWRRRVAHTGTPVFGQRITD